MQIKSKWITLQRSDKHNDSALNEKRGEMGEWAEKNAKPWNASFNNGHLLVEALIILTICSAHAKCTLRKKKCNSHRSLEVHFKHFDSGSSSGIFVRCRNSYSLFIWPLEKSDVDDDGDDDGDNSMYSCSKCTYEMHKWFLRMNCTEQELESGAARSLLDAFVFETPETV